MDAAPEFWAFAIPPGGTLAQHVPKDGCVCLTSAVLSAPSSDRVVLTAKCGSMSAVLCNLFGNTGHDIARLGQPFHEDFELSVSGGSATVHVSGFARGEVGPAEINSSKKQQPSAAKKTAKPAEEEVDDEEDDDEDDEDGEEGEDDYDDEDDDDEGEEEEGEEEEDSEDDDDEEEEDGDMPLAPKSVEELLKGNGAANKRKAAGQPTVAASKVAKKEAPAPAPAPAKPAAPAVDKATFGEKAAKPAGPVKLPSGVEVTDVSVGSGPLCQRGKRVNVKYYGTLVNGKKFDAGTIAFRLGGGEVIPGWDQGIQGMRVGGKRKLRIPPAQGYGKRGAPPTIPGNATLLFDVQLLSC